MLSYWKLILENLNGKKKMKKEVFMSALLLSVFVYFGCKKSDNTPSNVVSLTTSIATEITDSSVVSGGNIISSGAGQILARGICWSTSANPTTADQKTVNGTGKGEFSSDLKGLTGSTTYYVRAYVTTTTGTFYGNVVVITTPPKQLANEIFIEGFAFTPETLTVPVNTTVRWNNLDGTTHTVTSDSGLFDSSYLATGSWFSYQFTIPGTYGYHCSIHTIMTGTVVVQ